MRPQNVVEALFDSRLVHGAGFLHPGSPWAPPSPTPGRAAPRPALRWRKAPALFLLTEIFRAGFRLFTSPLQNISLCPNSNSRGKHAEGGQELLATSCEQGSQGAAEQLPRKTAQKRFRGVPRALCSPWSSCFALRGGASSQDASRGAPAFASQQLRLRQGPGRAVSG